MVIRLTWLLFVLPAAVRAECSDFAQGIKYKISEYQAYKKRNLESLETDLATEKGCEAKGATVSAKLAGLADALSCRAQLDASGVDRQMHELGERCEGTFRKIHTAQVELHARYKVVKKDMEDVMRYLKIVPVLDGECGPELAYGRRLVQEFVQLEGEITGVEARALDGKVSYGKFKDVAKALHTDTSARGQSCGAALEAFAAASTRAKGTKGQGAAVPTGRSPAQASTITGTEKKTPSLKR